MPRKPINDKLIDAACDILKSKIKQKIAKKGSLSLITTHEALGMITEEYLELNKAVRKNDIDNFGDELWDILIMAMWAVISRDIGALEW